MGFEDGESGRQLKHHPGGKHSSDSSQPSDLEHLLRSKIVSRLFRYPGDDSASRRRVGDISRRELSSIVRDVQDIIRDSALGKDISELCSEQSQEVPALQSKLSESVEELETLKNKVEIVMSAIKRIDDENLSVTSSLRDKLEELVYDLHRKELWVYRIYAKLGVEYEKEAEEEVSEGKGDGADKKGGVAEKFKEGEVTDGEGSISDGDKQMFQDEDKSEKGGVTDGESSFLDDDSLSGDDRQMFQDEDKFEGGKVTDRKGSIHDDEQADFEKIASEMLEGIISECSDCPSWANDKNSLQLEEVTSFVLKGNIATLIKLKKFNQFFLKVAYLKVLLLASRERERVATEDLMEQWLQQSVSVEDVRGEVNAHCAKTIESIHKCLQLIISLDKLSGQGLKLDYEAQQNLLDCLAEANSIKRARAP